MIYRFYHSFCKSRRKTRQNNIEDGTQKKLVRRSRTEKAQEEKDMYLCPPTVPRETRQFR
jgi:hypothetical protein